MVAHEPLGTYRAGSDDLSDNALFFHWSGASD